MSKANDLFKSESTDIITYLFQRDQPKYVTYDVHIQHTIYDTCQF